MVNRDAAASLKSRARALGFSHVGIASAASLAHESEHLRAWLSCGYEAGMSWLGNDTDRRADPARVLPGARSVIVLGYNYYSPERHSDDAGVGKISRYAWGDDYHHVLPPLLAELESTLRELVPGALSRSYVDTGPVMEKAWAARAGIGWLGKHTNIITRDHGSWIFLGVILTTAELACDAPAVDRCGSCARCIDACPTQAIVAPYVLDARRCIPYLTIELKGDAIPGGEDMDFRRWIFGCDICQDVCPWNSFSRPTRESRFFPRPELLSLRLEEMEHMAQPRFSGLFRRSPVKRAKLSGLRRNARTVVRQQASKTSTS
jgi:epoxyqueuosine reductase